MTQDSRPVSQSLTPQPRLIARTPLDQWHSQHGARFAECDGWRIPAAYKDVPQEIAATRSGLGLVDISALAKVRLVGSAVPFAVQRFAGNQPAGKPGSVFPIERGGRLTACSLGPDHILILAATLASSDLYKNLASAIQDLSIDQQDVTCALAGVHLIGPSADLVLRRLMSFDVSQCSFPAGSCAETSCLGIHATVIRDAQLDIPAVRIYVSWDFGEYLWEGILDAGRSLGITPVGIDAWRQLIPS